MLINKKQSFGLRLKKDLIYNKEIYLLLIPVLLYYIIFHYGPIYGALIAFKKYTPAKGFLGSPWIGFDNFIRFFKSINFVRLVKNTVLLSLCSIIFGFPAPIILALLLNEVRNEKYKRIVQTTTYLPHFISIVVVCGIIKNFLGVDGVINDMILKLGGEKISFMQRSDLFRPIFIMSGVWQEVGWGSIIYLAALSRIDPTLYQAATIDGAGRFRQLLHVTLPGISMTIVVLFILRMGKVMTIGFEKVMLLYSPAIYDTSDVISTYVYRVGLKEFSYSYSTAIGLFNSFINCLFLIMSNYISKKVNGQGLW